MAGASAKCGAPSPIRNAGRATPRLVAVSAVRLFLTAGNWDWATVLTCHARKSAFARAVAVMCPGALRKWMRGCVIGVAARVIPAWDRSVGKNPRRAGSIVAWEPRRIPRHAQGSCSTRWLRSAGWR